MNSITLLAILALSFSQFYEPATVSNECSSNPENKCASCWSSGNCYTCKPGYIFSSGQLTCYQPNPRDISGFGRSCAICGDGNYVGPAPNYQCMPCPYPCKTCSLVGDGPICMSCKDDIGGTSGYILAEDCSCNYGKEMDEGCYCNEALKFIKVAESGKECNKCDHCSRCERGCESIASICPTNMYPPTQCGCCEPCDESCNECTGPTRNDCNACRNTELWESVAGLKECYCVCYSDMVLVDATNDIYECRCLGNRVKGEVAGAPEGHSFQCVCPEGMVEADEKDANGFLDCVPA